MSKIAYLQREHEGLPAGTPLERAEMSSAHHLAKAMVGNSIPAGYYKLAGTEGPATLMVPSFEGLIGNLHPNDPSHTGPYSCTGYEVVGPDRLPVKYLAKIEVGNTYPTSKVLVIPNDLPGGNIVSVGKLNCEHVNYERHLKEALQYLEETHKDVDLKVVYLDSW